MGKSFNDDIFNNDINLDSINGLNISKEAIEENKEQNKPKNTKKIDISKINLDEVKKEIQEEKEKAKEQTTPKDEIEQLIQEQETIKESQKEYDIFKGNENNDKDDDNKVIYVKKTMIFKQDYLNIINGISSIKGTEIKMRIYVIEL